MLYTIGDRSLTTHCMTIPPPTIPMFPLHNRHGRDCGEPPHLTNNDHSRYYGYFENEHGDQWIFVDDPATGTAILRSGDRHWGTTHTMRGPKDLPPGMTDLECAWASACWHAAQFSMLQWVKTAASSIPRR